MRPLTDEEMEMLRSYLWADSGGGDLTSEIFLDEEAIADIIMEDEGMVSGIEPAVFLFEETGCLVELNSEFDNGGPVNEGAKILTVTGPVQGLLRAERIVLNILSRMSGIASLAFVASQKAEGSSHGTRVAGTRKTPPGFTLFEKRALIDGNALPHRKDLSSLAMLKDNHISAFGGVPDDISDAIGMIRDVHGPYIKIEVEVEDLESGLKAVEGGADIVMLDNMSPEIVAEVSKDLRKRASELGREITLEASGGIGIDNIEKYAPHVDVISMGNLTYGARPLGFKLEFRGNVDIVDV
jgi:nicotinate-nucleotide pyrophosphorylase (carboxylating)